MKPLRFNQENSGCVGAFAPAIRSPFSIWLLATPTADWIALGGGIAGLGLIIRAIAAGHLRKDRELATTGPYARTRNPLYLGKPVPRHRICDCRTFLVGRQPGARLFRGFLLRGHAQRGRRPSRAFWRPLRSIRRARSAFLPNFFDSGRVAPADVAPEQAFSWTQYRRNREYKALVGTIAGLAVVWLRMWLHQHYGY